MADHNIYRDGHVHVLREMCKTCIFRPGNRMQLMPGRVREMIDEAVANDGAIVCHSTLDGDNAVCRGFYDRHAPQMLQVATRLGAIREVDEPQAP